MNPESYAKRLRQVLAVSLLVAVVAAPLFFVVMPVYSSVGDLQEQIEQERTLLGRLEAAAKDAGMSAQLDKQTTAMRTSGLFLEGDSEAIRIASLQTLLTSIASASGIKPRSMRTLLARDKNDMRMVGVQVQMAAQIEQLRKILLSIEDHQRFLIVDGLHISPLPSVGSGTEEQGLLDVKFDVFGIEYQVK